MILCDREIEKCLKQEKIMIHPFDRKQLQPASYDFKLGDQFQIMDQPIDAIIDPRDIQPDLMRPITVMEGGFYVLHPQEFILGASLEFFSFGDDICGRVEGKSSLGRLGLLIHITAGFFDPGFNGTATLEMYNVSGLPIKLYPHMLIGQMSFHWLTGRAERPYGHPDLNSKYKGQMGPTPSKYGQVK